MARNMKDVEWNVDKINLFLYQALGMDLVSVLDQMYIKEVVVVGDGAGANIALRYVVH